MRKNKNDSATSRLGTVDARAGGAEVYIAVGYESIALQAALLIIRSISNGTRAASKKLTGRPVCGAAEVSRVSRLAVPPGRGRAAIAPRHALPFVGCVWEINPYG